MNFPLMLLSDVFHGQAAPGPFQLKGVSRGQAASADYPFHHVMLLVRYPDQVIAVHIQSL